MEFSRTWQRRAGAAFFVLGLFCAVATIVIAQGPLD
jgi:hypothetical protein